MELFREPLALSPVVAGAVIVGGVRRPIAVTPGVITPVVARIIVAAVATIPATIGVIAAVVAAPAGIVGPAVTPAAVPANQLRVRIVGVGQPEVVVGFRLRRGRQRETQRAQAHNQRENRRTHNVPPLLRSERITFLFPINGNAKAIPSCARSFFGRVGGHKDAWAGAIMAGTLRFATGD